METITNKKVHVHLDAEKETLYLTELLENTMVFLYDYRGELIEKHKFRSPSIIMKIPGRGMYVLVMSHPNCQPEVRRIVY